MKQYFVIVTWSWIDDAVIILQFSLDWICESFCCLLAALKVTWSYNDYIVISFQISLTLSWRRPLSYRNQSIDLLRMVSSLRHERVKLNLCLLIIMLSKFGDNIRSWSGNLNMIKSSIFLITIWAKLMFSSNPIASVLCPQQPLLKELLIKSLILINLYWLRVIVFYQSRFNLR